MGIKDWFGGDKKKAAFREKIKAAVSDGRLSSKDLKELEKARQELGVSGAGDDRTVLRREVYNEAVAAVKKDGEISGTDAHELAKIQKFLALRGVQLEPGEAAHYSMTVEMFDLPSTRQNDGVRAEWNKAYDSGSAKAHVLPEDGAKAQGDASLVITNRRLVLKTEGGKISLSAAHSWIAYRPTR